MHLLIVILIMIGLVFLVYGYRIYFRGHYHLINGFEANKKAGRKTQAQAKKAGFIELLIGLILVIIALLLAVLR